VAECALKTKPNAPLAIGFSKVYFVSSSLSHYFALELAALSGFAVLAALIVIK